MGSTLWRSAQWTRTWRTCRSRTYGRHRHWNTDPPSQAVQTAIRDMKRGKAPGIDMLHTEMLLADIATASRVLTDLFTNIWENNAIPKEWSKGLICKLPKKGDLKNCDNWWGITLLSVPSKVFCKILLKWFDSAIDVKLREEQAGFRKGRGCIVRSLPYTTLSNSVHRESLWKILKAYGMPSKIVNIIGKFYEHFECSVIPDNTLTESFPI